MISLNILVNGRVQNVGFSEKVKEYADTVNVSGKIWDNYDGSVEIIAFVKNKTAMNSFIENIKIGSQTSSISEININIIVTDPSLEEGFEIVE